MKHIFRSPIEPEFAELTVRTFRQYAAGIKKAAASALLSFQGFLSRRQKNLRESIERKADIIHLWVEHARFAVAEYWKKKQYQKESHTDSEEVLPSPDFPSQVAEPSQRQTGDIAKIAGQLRAGVQVRLPQFFSAAQKKVRQFFGAVSLTKSWQFFALLFMVGILAGTGLKVVARETVTIGFEDYKVGASENRIDLNRLQDKLLAAGNTPSKGSALAGEQCTE